MSTSTEPIFKIQLITCTLHLIGSILTLMQPTIINTTSLLLKAEQEENANKNRQNKHCV
jgi:hypothetical protein